MMKDLSPPGYDAGYAAGYAAGYHDGGSKRKKDTFEDDVMYRCTGNSYRIFHTYMVPKVPTYLDVQGSLPPQTFGLNCCVLYIIGMSGMWRSPG